MKTIGTFGRMVSIAGCWLLMLSTAMAQLKIEAVYPTLGKIGQDLPITITGEDFDQYTRVSLSLDTGNEAAIIGSASTPGEATAMAVDGTVMLVADGSGGLQTFDISDPTAPVSLGAVSTPGYAVDVAITGKTAVVADEDRGLQIIDVSDPTRPSIVGGVETPGVMRAVCLSGNYAYAAADESGLLIVDISEPSAPVIVGTVDTPGTAWDVAVSGNLALVADGYAGLQAIDIADATQPAIIGSVATPGNPAAVVVVNDLAFVADHDGLQVVDIADPTTPAIAGTVETPGWTLDLFVSGTTVFVVEGDSGLQAIDISVPDAPSILGSSHTPGYATGVVVMDNLVFVADLESGLQVIDTNDLSPYRSIGSVEMQGWARRLAIADDIVYVADSTNGLQVIDIADPMAPTRIGFVATPGSALDLAIVGNLAYVADYETGLQVIDIAAPDNPTIIGSVDTPGHAHGVCISGNLAFVADDDSGLQIIDIADPAHPTIIGAVDTPGLAGDIAVSGETALVADDDKGLQIIDISDPTDPTIVGVVNVVANCVTISGNTAYIAAEYDNFHAIDISDPRVPVITGAADIMAMHLSVVGTRVYAASGGSGIQLLDLTDIHQPVVVGAVDTRGITNDVVISGEIAIVADHKSGVVIVPIPVEIASVDVDNQTTMTLVLPGQTLDGSYNLRVFDATDNHEMSGAVSFLNAVDFEPKSQMKAIIVAGGGDYAGNSLYASTCLVANQAYKTLISQGYTKENIYYLGDHSVDLFPDDDIANDVDASATSANLQYAINTWAADASELLLYMTDHGKQGTFQLSADEPYFKAEQLDAWLDSLQATMTGQVVCVYDACNSGSFIPLLTPPAGAERIVITSAKADEAAWFMNQGVNSFSYQFWASTWLKGSLYDAFVDAKNMMAFDQTALLDADGDGVASTKEDMAIAGPIPIGRGRSAASLPPSIMAVSDDQTINGPAQVTLWADLGTDALATIDTVWAVVVPPDLGDSATDIPVTDLTSVDLTDTDGDGKYEGQYSGFTQNGVYQVIVYAKDKDDLYSLPASFSVDQRQGSSTGPDADGGYDITSELWAKAVLDVSGSPVTLVWKLVGADITPSGDQVISGYFYADPDDFAYGSVYNPELFVKIYIATNGWCNMAFNHVTVDDVSVYSMGGEASQSSTATLNTRLVEHQYSGVAIETSLQTTGETAASSTGEGYTLSSGLWARAVLQPSTGDVNLIWKQVGTDTTPSGDTVVSGYFYASPEDFPYGSLYNPEVFVKVYIAANGWANMAFNHVTVDTVAIASARDADGTDGQSATASLGNRLVEHAYTGVGVQ